MKIRHNPHASWQRPSAVVDDAYQAEVDRSTAKAERLYQQAQKRLEAAEARLARVRDRVAARTDRKLRKQLAQLEALVEIRRAELEDIRRLMNASPASAEHRGTRSFRPVPFERSGL